MRAFFAFSVVMLTGLAGCGPPGRVRVSERELVGNYVLEFQSATSTAKGEPVASPQGREQLTLNADKTYVQIFSTATRQFSNRGAWKSNSLLGSTEIELAGAIVSESDPPTAPSARGSLMLQVHRERGQLKLARNEAADWYYERVR
jgi:hypothetical protein